MFYGKPYKLKYPSSIIKPTENIKIFREHRIKNFQNRLLAKYMFFKIKIPKDYKRMLYKKFIP